MGVMKRIAEVVGFTNLKQRPNMVAHALELYDWTLGDNGYAITVTYWNVATYKERWTPDCAAFTTRKLPAFGSYTIDQQAEIVEMANKLLLNHQQTYRGYRGGAPRVAAPFDECLA